MYLLCSVTNTLLLLRFTLAPSLLSQRVGIGSGYSIKKNESIKCMSLRGQNDKYICWSAMLGCIEDGLVGAGFAERQISYFESVTPAAGVRYSRNELILRTLRPRATLLADPSLSGGSGARFSSCVLRGCRLLGLSCSSLFQVSRCN
jgi:hypothetical protein